MTDFEIIDNFVTEIWKASGLEEATKHMHRGIVQAIWETFLSIYVRPCLTKDESKLKPEYSDEKFIQVCTASIDVEWLLARVVPS